MYISLSPNVYSIYITDIHWDTPVCTLGYTCIYISLHFMSPNVYTWTCNPMYIRQNVPQCIYTMYIKCCTMYIGVYTFPPNGLYIGLHCIYIWVFLDIRPRCRLSNAITVHPNIHWVTCQCTLGIYIGLHTPPFYIHWVTFPLNIHWVTAPQCVYGVTQCISYTLQLYIALFWVLLMLTPPL